VKKWALAIGFAFVLQAAAACGSERARDSAQLDAYLARFDRATDAERARFAADAPVLSCTSKEMRPTCEVCARGVVETARALSDKLGIEHSLREVEVAMVAGAPVREEAAAALGGDRIARVREALERARDTMRTCEAQRLRAR
jgi:hypothetical protein